MENLPMYILILLLLAFFLMTVKESFSSSGMTISDEYCHKLANVYYKPTDNNPSCRDKYNEKICGHSRRNNIDFRTGNYFTENGVLV